MRLRLETAERRWPLVEPFAIARGVQHSADMLVATVTGADGAVGRGEAAGVPYEGETPACMRAELEAVRAELEAGPSRRDLLDILPPGGARNAVDAALWDLEAKSTGVPAWRAAGLDEARPVASCVTIGIRDLAAYERRARELADHPWIKVKVAADDPVAAVRAVRRGAPNASLLVDANQAWDVPLLERLMDDLLELGVALIEQPVPVGQDHDLDAAALPIPLVADEAARDARDLPALVGRYRLVNIKLDKVGGLTAGLDFARDARAAGLGVMVGNMMGGSLAMAPAAVLAQGADVADLDGPLLQVGDWPDAPRFVRGVMAFPPRALWG